MIHLQEATKLAIEEVTMGRMSTDEANVYIVQLMGARLITSPMPASVRKSLNEAVKNGKLGHIKKDGLKPEAYHHINGRARALDEIQKHYNASMNGISKVVGFNEQLHS